MCQVVVADGEKSELQLLPQNTKSFDTSFGPDDKTPPSDLAVFEAGREVWQAASDG